MFGEPTALKRAGLESFINAMQISGTNSLIAEIELVQLYDEVFDSLGLKIFPLKLITENS